MGVVASRRGLGQQNEQSESDNSDDSTDDVERETKPTHGVQDGAQRGTWMGRGESK